MRKNLHKIFIIFILLNLIILNSYATNNNFSIVGIVQEENGTPIRGISVNLFEIINDSSENVIQSTITDNQGNFHFFNISTNASTCEIRMGNLNGVQYFPVGTGFKVIKTTGIQNITFTRPVTLNDLPPDKVTSKPDPSVPVNIPINPEYTLLAFIISVGICTLFKK